MKPKRGTDPTGHYSFACSNGRTDTLQWYVTFMSISDSSVRRWITVSLKWSDTVRGLTVQLSLVQQDNEPEPQRSRRKQNNNISPPLLLGGWALRDTDDTNLSLVRSCVLRKAMAAHHPLQSRAARVRNTQRGLRHSGSDLIRVNTETRRTPCDWPAEQQQPRAQRRQSAHSHPDSGDRNSASRLIFTS